MPARSIQLLRTPGKRPGAANPRVIGVDILEAAIRAAEPKLQRQADPPAPAGPLFGRILALGSGGLPIVEFSHAGIQHVTEAETLVPTEEGMRGRRVALLFAGGDIRRPLVIGLLQSAEGSGASRPGEAKPDLAASGRRMRLSLDGDRVTLQADQELLLECGKASIHLRKDGKVVIKGVDIVSRASATNKVKGGAIHLN